MLDWKQNKVMHRWQTFFSQYSQTEWKTLKKRLIFIAADFVIFAACEIACIITIRYNKPAAVKDCFESF